MNDIMFIGSFFMGILDKENLIGDGIVSLDDVLKKSDVHLDACIINFASIIMDTLIENGIVELIDDTSILSVACVYPIYRVKGTNIGVVKTTVGAPITSTLIEEIGYVFDCNKMILFGTCGVLDRSIDKNKVILPSFAYRDEGVSYHYVAPKDTIDLPGYITISKILDALNIDYVIGGTWTTDAFYRETLAKFNKVKEAGCIAVEMEIAACQAVADFRNIDFYAMLFRGDNLDSEKWERGFTRTLPTDERLKRFFIALEVAKRVID